MTFGSFTFTWEAGFVPASIAAPAQVAEETQSLSSGRSSDCSSLVEGCRWSLWLGAPLPSRGWAGALLQQSALLVIGDREERLLVTILILRWSWAVGAAV